MAKLPMNASLQDVINQINKALTVNSKVFTHVNAAEDFTVSTLNNFTSTTLIYFNANTDIVCNLPVNFTSGIQYYAQLGELSNADTIELYPYFSVASASIGAYYTVGEALVTQVNTIDKNVKTSSSVTNITAFNQLTPYVQNINQLYSMRKMPLRIVKKNNTTWTFLCDSFRNQTNGYTFNFPNTTYIVPMIYMRAGTAVQINV